MKKVSKITVRWDDKSDPNNIGWYCIAYDADGEELMNSMMIYFPVYVDGFDADEKSALIDALKAEFPDAEIEDLD